LGKLGSEFDGSVDAEQPLRKVAAITVERGAAELEMSGVCARLLREKQILLCLEKPPVYSIELGSVQVVPGVVGLFFDRFGDGVNLVGRGIVSGAGFDKNQEQDKSATWGYEIGTSIGGGLADGRFHPLILADLGSSGGVAICQK
jgi:hypothetical protein